MSKAIRDPQGRWNGSPVEARLSREMELVRDLVDVDYYFSAYPDVAEAGEDAVEHFCRTGWIELLKPNPWFDVWWYWSAHLDPAADDVNPLVHYALEGRAAGLSTQPTGRLTSPGVRLDGVDPRRACLFAFYDEQGVVDEATLSYVRELSRHSDVFFLADCYLAKDQLDKVREFATDAWSRRHGGYDFGSYSVLARDLVGWDRLATYDEVLFVNDSCYLLRPLDEVFEEMDGRACDWWGLQATKGIARTREQPGNKFTEPIPLDAVRDVRLPSYEEDPVYDFLIGSYFLAFRGPVLADQRFRALIDSVHPQPSKLLVIQKYEIGLTHLLIGLGYRFDTFIPDLHPFHPIFTEQYFTLLERGFPLLKRYLLAHNHYDVPGLADWKRRVLEHCPGAPVESFEESLRRTAPDDRLQRSFAITVDDDGSPSVPAEMRRGAFVRRDRKVAKDPATWVFAVDPRLHTLPESSRAVFEAVRDDDSVRKVILTRSRRLALGGRNTHVEPLTSPQGRKLLLEAGVALVGHRPRASLQARADPRLRTVVVVRDGLELERTLSTDEAPTPRWDDEDDQRGTPLAHLIPPTTISGLLTASDADRLAAIAAHRPATFAQAWLTGLPWHDFLRMPSERLPDDMRAAEEDLAAQVAGRRLVLFQPSVRSWTGDARPYPFTDREIEHLVRWAERTDAVIGIREQPDDRERAYSSRLLPLLGRHGLDLSPQRVETGSVALRAADVVLTDYSGVALDALVPGTPAISFVHDLGEARHRLLYDLEHMFPGPVCQQFDDMLAELDRASAWGAADHAKAARVRDLLVAFDDDQSTQRAIARIRTEQLEMHA